MHVLWFSFDVSGSLVSLLEVLAKYVSLHPVQTKKEMERAASTGTIMKRYLSDCGRKARRRPKFQAAVVTKDISHYMHAIVFTWNLGCSFFISCIYQVLLGKENLF